MLIENETPLGIIGIKNENNEQGGYTLIIKGHFQLQHDKIAEPKETPPEFSGDKIFQDKIGRSLQWPNDLEFFKPNLDFIIQGSFYAPENKAVTQSTAGFKFGPLGKTVRIIGARKAVRDANGRWLVEGPTALAELPLRWEYSAGGLSDLRNPFGLGQDGEPSADTESMVYHLPMIEGVSDIPWTPEAKPEPVNFAAVPTMFSLRQHKLGTRDRRWSLFRAPLPPLDYDPSYANAAPLGQQAVGEPMGSETMHFYNMHPIHSEFICTMPDFRPYAAAILDGTNHAVPIKFRLDTIVAQPDREEMFILWRARVPGAESEKDVTRVVCHWCKLDDIHTSETLAAELTLQMRKDAEEELHIKTHEFNEKFSSKMDFLEKQAQNRAQDIEEARIAAMHDIQSLAGYEKLPSEFKEQLSNLSSFEDMEKLLLKQAKVFEEQARLEYQKLLKMTGQPDTTGLFE